MIDTTEVMSSVRAAALYARFVAKGRLHWDDCESEAGLAVVRAMRSFDPAKSRFTTYTRRIVRNAVLGLIRRNSRYERKSDAWFDQLPARNETSGGETSQDAEAALLDVGSRREVAARLGITQWKAAKLIRRHRNGTRKKVVACGTL